VVGTTRFLVMNILTLANPMVSYKTCARVAEKGENKTEKWRKTGRVQYNGDGGERKERKKKKIK